LIAAGISALLPSPIRGAERLIWHDGFSGSSLDLTKWTYEVGNLNVNNELEYYTPANAKIERVGPSSHLVLTATNGSPEPKYNYSSARIMTKNLLSVKYGRVEARIKLPEVMGMWPAFWMLGENINTVGWPQCGEIDIMEQVNNDPTTHATAHWWDGTQHV